MNTPSAFLDRLPKSELHIHIEGSLEPELMFALAQRNKVRLPYASVEEIRRAYDFGNLQDFLDLYYQGMSVLQTEQDFYDLAWAYFSRVAAQKVSYVELFFDPQGHTSRGVAFATALDGIDRARADAAAKLGLKSRIIMCFLRHLDEADAERTLDTALDYKGRIAGVGLDFIRGRLPAQQVQECVPPRPRGRLPPCRPCRRGRSAAICLGSAGYPGRRPHRPWQPRDGG